MTTTVLADQLRQLDTDGYAMLPDVLPAGECDYWSVVLDRIWEREHDKPHTYDDEPGVRYVENLLEYYSMFQRCVTEEVVVAAAGAILGPGMRFSLINYRRTEPGSGNQALHCQKLAHGSPPRACDAIWCLDEFTALNGTRVLPGSHVDNHAVLARLDDPLARHPGERVIQASRGSVLVFSASLIHGGTTNRGTGPRRCILTQFVRAGQQPRFDWSQLPLPIQRQFRPDAAGLLSLPSHDALAQRSNHRRS
ncbi:MAG: phytanoyl-CoA dioxygenase family protein [Streptosporangiaceae bacterium]|nr:phytanoyl-CoA dioxygenase family protein [Streptosporangiaceae bacterium]